MGAKAAMSAPIAQLIWKRPSNFAKNLPWFASGASR